MRGNRDDAQKTLLKVFTEGRAEINGDSYVPAVAVDDYNNQYGTSYPFFADDEVPCVNTNECHAKAAGKCPFRTRDFEDCAGKECTVQQSEQERFRNTDIFQTLLQKYQKVFGEIIFPDEPENGQSEVRREIYANPAG